MMRGPARSVALAPSLALPLLTGVALAALAQPAAAQDAAATTAPVSSPVPAPGGVKRVFTQADFARFAPSTAYDMLLQVPGFVIREATVERGLGQASENVLLNGQRVPSKSGGAIAAITRLSAKSVERIEIVDAASLDIPGLTGQVANIVATTKKAGGQFQWKPEFRPHYTDPIFTRGMLSYSGTRGIIQYTLSLDSQGSRSGAGGPTIEYDGLGVPVEYRDDRFRDNYDAPKLAGNLIFDLAGSAVANLNASYQRYRDDYRELGHRDRVVGPDRDRTVHTRETGRIAEVNADVAFDMGPGRLKLIGLRHMEKVPSSSTVIFDYADDSPDTGNRFARVGRSSETIARAEYGWKWGKADVQLSGEAAYNRLKLDSHLFNLAPDGDFIEQAFVGSSGDVREKRYEALLTYGRPLTSNLTMQLVGGAERSTLSQNGDNGLVRHFVRPKGSLSLAWKPNALTDVNFKLRRRVGQLDFYDFLARVYLGDDQQNAGNADLVPPQSWETELEVARDFKAWGRATVRLFANRIDDIIDVIPIGVDGESPGNLDRARQYGIEGRGTLLFDPIGWKGAKLDFTLLAQRSRLADPLTGVRRSINGDVLRSADLTLRYDIPRSDWALGGSLSYEKIAYSYRLTEYGLAHEGPVFAGLYVERKDLAGMTARFTANNLLNARSRWDRFIYDGRRNTNDLVAIERRDRLIGPIFTFSLKGSF